MEIYYAERRVVIPISARWRTKFVDRCPNLEIVHMVWCRSAQTFLKHAPMVELLEYFKTAVQFMKAAFPKLERVLLPALEDCTRRRKSEDGLIWMEICDFLEENDWVVGAEV